MTPFAVINTIWFILLITPIFSYSACDDINIQFIIDTDSIINNSDNVENFIQYEIWNGSSEYSAISVTLYGDHITYDNSIIINLSDTH